MALAEPIVSSREASLRATRSLGKNRHIIRVSALPGHILSPLYPGEVVPHPLPIVIEHDLPGVISLKLWLWLDSKVPDQQLDDVLEEYATGREMKPVDIDRSTVLGVWAGKRYTGSAGGMHMWKCDVADALWMLVIKEQFLTFEIENLIEVARGSDSVGSAVLVLGDMDDGVLVDDIEQEIWSSAIPGPELKTAIESGQIRLHRYSMRKADLIPIAENVGLTNAGN